MSYQARWGGQWGGHRDRGCNAIVALPPGMSPGAIIGKGGSNIKMLQQRSGARLSVSPGRVEIQGSDAAVREASQLLQQQIKAFQATGGGYPHPAEVCYLLTNALASNDSAQLGFVRVTGEVADATDRHEALHALKTLAQEPQGSAAGSGASSHMDSLTAMLAGTQLGGGTGAKSIFQLEASDGERVLVSRMVAAAGAACSHAPKLDEIKLRFNLGKALWYNGAREGERLTVPQLQAQRIPEDMKAVFSNAVETGVASGSSNGDGSSSSASQQASSFERWLAASGFKEVSQKSTCSMHVMHKAAHAAYAISFIVEDGSLTIRKIKSATTKLCFLTLLGPHTQPDWRAKLLGQYAFNGTCQQGALLRALAGACRVVTAGGPGACSSLDTSGAGLVLADHEVKRVRFKHKRVLEGSFSGDGGKAAVMLKVTISSVTNEHGQQHTEVGGCCPELNATLCAALAAAGLESAQQEAVSVAMSGMLAFARAATAELGVA